MTITSDVPFTHSVERTRVFLFDEGGKIACSAITGMAFSYCFLWINPGHGALFCVLDSLVSRVMDFVLDKFLNIHATTNEVKTLSKMLSIALSTVILSGVITLFGGSLGFQASLVLGIATFASLILYKLGCQISKTVGSLI